MFAGPRDFVGNAAAAMLAPIEFRLECGLPVWVYDVWGGRIEKRLLLPYKQNTVHIEYRYVEGSGAIRLGLRPGIHFRTSRRRSGHRESTPSMFLAPPIIVLRYRRDPALPRPAHEGLLRRGVYL